MIYALSFLNALHHRWIAKRLFNSRICFLLR
ncbi:hypothetical protein [Acinetobacter phage Ab69]|nr:hypothetical protein [Acinetobacter phage Ab69]